MTPDPDPMDVGPPDRDAGSEQHDYPPPPMPRPPGRTQTIVGFVMAAAAVVFVPVILGPIGSVLGAIGHRKGDPLGRWAMIAGVVGTVLGTLLLILFADSDDEALALVR